MRKTFQADLPIAGVRVPACVQNVNFNSHAVGNVDLAEDAFLIHGLEIRLSVPPLVAFLKIPRVVADVRLAACKVPSHSLVNETAECRCEINLVTADAAGLKPHSFVTMAFANRLPREVVALHRAQGDGAIGADFEVQK